MREVLICRRCALEVVMEGGEIVEQGITCNAQGHGIGELVSGAVWSVMQAEERGEPIIMVFLDTSSKTEVKDAVELIEDVLGHLNMQSLVVSHLNGR
jgi:hypothetical protein